jgi:hypothetical protein
MAHIQAIGANLYTDLSVGAPATALTAAGAAALTTATGWQALFASEIANVGGTKAANAFVRVTNVREFPEIGIPPNLVNVPVYGQATSQQVQAQSDMPSMEVTVNLVMADWSKDAGVILGNAVGDGSLYAFRFTLLNAEPTGTTATKWASTAGGLGTVPNSQWYWAGSVDSFLVSPSLSDAGTGKVAFSVKTKLFGAYTI